VDRVVLPGQQVGLQRLAQQRVPEAVAAALGDQKLAGDGLAQQLHHDRWRQLADGREQRVVKAAPGGRGDPQQPLHRGAERLGPHQQQVAERLGQRAAVQPVGGDELLDEEGIALGVVHDGAHGLRRRP